MARTFAINMVGLFYNTFMPGSTGGDLVKAWYASKHTTHRTWAVISVLIDRAIGLAGAGDARAARWRHSMVANSRLPKSRRSSPGAAGADRRRPVHFYIPLLRRRTGFDFFFSGSRVQRQVRNIVQGLEMYGHDRPAKTLLALRLCFPVHMTSIVSAMLAGHAFGLTFRRCITGSLCR